MEFNENETDVFDEIMEVVDSHPDFERYELRDEPALQFPGLEIYPDQRKIYRDRREIQGTASSLFPNNIHKQSCFLVGLYFFARIFDGGGGIQSEAGSHVAATSGIIRNCQATWGGGVDLRGSAEL